mgnify:CR=1 FL=1
MNTYPEAKVILTLRDFDGWYESNFNTIWQVEPTNDCLKFMHDTYLVKQFNNNFGSKDIAEKAADDEINFMIDLCKSHELGSLLSISREWSDEGIKEKFRNLPKADSCAEQKIWTFVEDD